MINHLPKGVLQDVKTLRFRILLRKFLHQMVSWFRTGTMIRSIKSGDCPFLCFDCKYKSKLISECLQFCPKWSKAKLEKILDLDNSFCKVSERDNDKNYSKTWNFCSHYYNQHIIYSSTIADELEKFMIKTIKRFVRESETRKNKMIKKIVRR